MTAMLDSRLVDNKRVLKYLLPPSDLESAKAQGAILFNTLDTNMKGTMLFERNYLESKAAAKFKIHTNYAFVLIRTKVIMNGIDVKVQIIDGMRNGIHLMRTLWDSIGHSPCVITKRNRAGILCVDLIDEKGRLNHIVVRSFDVDSTVRRENKKGKQTTRVEELKKLGERYSKHLNDIEGISMLTNVYTSAEL